MVLRSRLIAIGLTVVLVSVLIFSVSAANSPITTNSGITPDLRTPPPNPQPPATLQSILNAVNNIVPTLETYISGMASSIDIHTDYAISQVKQKSVTINEQITLPQMHSTYITVLPPSTNSTYSGHMTIVYGSVADYKVVAVEILPQFDFDVAASSQTLGGSYVIDADFACRGMLLEVNGPVNSPSSYAVGIGGVIQYTIATDVESIHSP